MEAMIVKAIIVAAIAAVVWPYVLQLIYILLLISAISFGAGVVLLVGRGLKTLYNNYNREYVNLKEA